MHGLVIYASYLDIMEIGALRFVIFKGDEDFGCWPVFGMIMVIKMIFFHFLLCY